MIKQITRLKLIRAMAYPTNSEIALFSEWMHDDNLFNTATRNILYKYSSDEIINNNLSKIFNKTLDEIYWNSGSVGSYSQELSELAMYTKLLDLNVNQLYLST